jgi:agmatine deiminase
MITDDLTNYLYLSEQLQRHTQFFESLTETLNKVKVDYQILPHTKDIWCRDYMPLQMEANRFLQFRYEPTYLQSEKWIHTQTDSELVCSEIGIACEKSKLKLDGGNIIKGDSWVIITDKVFSENKQLTHNQVISELERLLQVKIIIIPREPYEMTGHADGILHYYSKDTVLVNHYEGNKSDRFQTKLNNSLKSAGISSIEVPYHPIKGKSLSAEGLYINFLQMDKFILVPSFDMIEEDQTFQLFEQLFPSSVIRSINSQEIAQDGGVLNCISWNIMKYKH